jgi:FAD/FMN-containing dehydrogenase
LSGQYGWAANNVLEFEVVLSNATVVRASERENSDLWSALRGGGGDFGIVTSFILRAVPQDHNVGFLPHVYLSIFRSC